MEAFPRQLEIYVTSEGRIPFLDWLDALKDYKGKAKIRVKIDRLSLGNFSDCKSLEDGVHELKVDCGPGYRVYYGQADSNIIILLCGGDKGTQKHDIKKAFSYWEDYKRR
ncbi:MAG: type II toxin-antitoxin system RelE/ParE family toxin [Nitrospirae bacterium YQR-1]